MKTDGMVEVEDGIDGCMVLLGEIVGTLGKGTRVKKRRNAAGSQSAPMKNSHTTRQILHNPSAARRTIMYAKLYQRSVDIQYYTQGPGFRTRSPSIAPQYKRDSREPVPSLPNCHDLIWLP
jgi:hypothetical protein